MHSMCAWNMIEQRKPLQTGHDTIYISEKFYKNTCICVPFWCEKNAGLNYREFDPIHGIYGPVFHNTIKTLKTVGYCGYG